MLDDSWSQLHLITQALEFRPFLRAAVNKSLYKGRYKLNFLKQIN